MNILITNDDGIHTDGLFVLCNELKKVGTITVVAPETEKSAVSHAITLHRPLRVREIRKNGFFFGYAVAGTPVDCVKLGVMEIIKHQVDLVVSGINYGANVGRDINYSGTVSAAKEAIALGIPAIAVSLSSSKNPDFLLAANFTKRFIQFYQNIGFRNDVAFNINVPAIPKTEIQGVNFTFQGQHIYRETFDKRIDPRDNTYYWLTIQSKTQSVQVGSDIHAIENGRISITPIHYDVTAYKYLKEMQELAELNHLA